MVKMSTVCFLLLALGIAESGLAAEMHAYKAVYASKLNGFNIRVKRRLEIQHDVMTISVDVKKFWLGMHESSVLQYHDDGHLYPSTHVHKRRGTSHEHDKDLLFNWHDGNVIDLLRPGMEPLSLNRPCYDKLSYQTQMRLDLLRTPGLQHVAYCVTNGVRNRVYSFDRLSEEVLKTRLGNLNTVKFKRSGDDDDRQVFVWVASDWDFLLVRIDEIKNKGGKIKRLLLNRANIAGQKVAAMPHRLANNTTPVEPP